MRIKEHNPNRKLICFMMLAVFLVETAFGLYLSCDLGILLNDAFSRTANAFYVVFVNPPRYASIGLVWNPLPSTLQIPFMFLAKLWRPIASKGIAAAITTAVFPAITIGILLDTFMKLKVSKKLALIISLIYTFNPFIFFYGCNGESESIAFFFMIYSVCSLTLWMKFGSGKYMIHLGFALAALFLTRYEAIPLAVAIGICVVLNIIYNPREDQYIPEGNKKERYYYIESTFILIFLPLAYVIFLWLLFNYVIAGSPFYFLNSVYGNVSQSTFAYVEGSVIDIFIHEMKRAIPFLPLFFSVVAIRYKQRKILSYDFLSLIILIMSILTFQFIMLLKGNSFGWLRYFSYSLPICIAWIPYEISQCKKKDLLFAKFAIILGLVLSSILCLYALNNSDLAIEEQTAQLTNESYVVADYINTNIPEDKVLMDVFTLSGVMLNIEHTENLVVSSSPNFFEDVNDPVGNNIDYILVPEINGPGSLDAINIAYPDLYKNGADWCKEVEEFDGFKLFKVIN